MFRPVKFFRNPILMNGEAVVPLEFSPFAPLNFSPVIRYERDDPKSYFDPKPKQSILIRTSDKGNSSVVVNGTMESDHVLVPTTSVSSVVYTPFGPMIERIPLAPSVMSYTAIRPVRFFGF